MQERNAVEEERDSGGSDDSARRRDGSIPEEEDSHLDDVPVGAGCTEIWEHLADRRRNARDEDSDLEQ